MRHLSLIVAVALGCAQVHACGPDFPVALLAQRSHTLLEMPEGIFAFESKRWAIPKTRFVVADADPWADPLEARQAAEIAGLSVDAAQALARMRAAADGEAAWALGADLSLELREYTAGAVDYHIGAWDRAQSRFARVVALPAEERRKRGIWAAYMLGRIAVQSNDIDAARNAFEQTRDFATTGGDDPLGLALASFGEQARGEWHRGDLPTALKLYAEQAALGSRSGQASLLMVARQISRTPALADAALQDDLGRRILVGYLFARDAELANVELLDRLAALPVNDVPDADRLAAVLYRGGDDARAARFAAGDTPLAAWVRAKLAVKQGRLDDAIGDYAKAARSFPADETWVDSNPFGDDEGLAVRCRVSAEAGTLALGRGEFLQALELLYAGAERHWTDFAYVAERVVTVAELRAFVDRVAPQAVATPEDRITPMPAQQARWLLARRLLRTGQGAEAIAYFDDPELRAAAQEYVAALDATGAWTKVGQARAWFRAAELMRARGLEIAGFEGDPDYAEYGGNYDLNSPYRYDENYNLIVDKRQDLAVEGPHTSDAERNRVALSRADPLMRFHYRGIAARHAEQAADRLPQRSQAYAAVLCTASSFVLVREPETAAPIYRRYLNHGAFVPWGAQFGQQCPAPDFAKVEQQMRAQWIALAGRIALIGGPLIVLLFVIRFWRSRKRS